jgi:pimeloyl-ACP methyl ester carboxylesterase
LKRINWKLVLAVLAVIVVSLVLAFVVWASDASPASDVALQAMQSDERVNVSEENGWVTFSPADDPQPDMGIVFYPGGRVDYRAYSPVLRMIAEQGYFVALVPVPLNLAFFDVNAAERVRVQYPEITHWVVGGHSLGGVAASVYAKDHVAELDGILFFASYPADDSLKNTDLNVFSIYGTRDMAGMDKFDETKALLPDDTQYVVIDGGNHAQFGSYGLQAGDNEATISPEEQWTQISTATVEFLKTLSQ